MTIDVGGYLDRFFSAPNQIDLDRLPQEVASLVGHLLARARSDDRPRTILPARVSGESRWYGIAQSAPEGRNLREEMKSWLGPPVGRHVAQVSPDSSDELDRIALELAGGEGVALVVRIAPKYLRAAREAMQQLLSLWEAAPPRQHAVPRPVGRVLRDFYDAILVRDRGAAENALDEIRSRGLLTPTNVRFLLVELLGVLGTPTELRDDARLAHISMVSRPPRVTDTLARAADALFIAPQTITDHASVLRIARDIEDCWPGLVVHPAQVRSAESARCLGIVESIPDTPRTSVVSLLQRDWAADPVVAQVLEFLAPAVSTRINADPLGLIAVGELEEALAACERLPATIANVSAALLAAHELGLADCAGRALHLLDRLGAAEAETLLSRAVQADRVATLRKLAAETTTADGWLQWLHSPGATAGRLDLLREWSLTLQLDGSVLTPDYVDALLIELIDALNDDRRAVVRDAIPVLLESLSHGDGLRPEAVRLCIEIADVVLASGAGSVERAVALDIMDRTFECGCTASEYKRLLDAVGEHFTEIGPRSIGFVADAISLVLDASVLDAGARDTLLARGFAAVLRSLERLDPTELLVLQHVFLAAGVPVEPFSEGEEALPPRARSPRVVGIYSLEESAARRAASWISEMVTDVDVRLSHEHVNSDRLVSTVRSAEVMLVHTSKATHAATDAIATAALGYTPVVRVSGRGASALFREFVRWLSSP